MVFRPTLPPGAVLTRHDATRLRIGTTPAILVPDTPAVRAIIAHADGVSPAPDVCAAAAFALGLLPHRHDEVRKLLSELVGRGAVVDASPLTRLRAPRNEVVASLLRGHDATVTDGRSRTVVGLHVAAGCHELGDLVRDGLDASGLTLEAEHTPGADLEVVLTLGEPRRDEIATVVMAGSRVLPVAVAGGRCVIGPWIVPGSTPCLDCSDLHQRDWDPQWSGHGHWLDRSDRPHGVGVDLALTVAGLLTAEVVAIAEGRRPRSTGARWTLGPEPHAARRAPVAFHPTCACHLLAFGTTDTAVS